MSWLTRYSDSEVLKEAIRRKTNSKTLIDGLFKQQKLFNRDPARFKAALNTRRSGKSYLAATRLILAALSTPRSVNPYLALTRDSAKRILWPTLVTLLETHKIEHEAQESALTVSFPKQKSQIFMVGADQKNFINRIRGIAAKLAAVDETQSFGEHLEELVNDVVTPALADFNGQLDLYGTPGLLPQGFFYDVTTGKIPGFSIHRWSIKDNPFMPQGFIEETMKLRGWTEENPTYRREWLGEWVLDEDSLLFKFKDKNLCSELPKDSLNRILGIDFGFDDKTAFVILAYTDKGKDLYIEHSEAYAGMIPSEIASFTEMLVKRFNPLAIVSDTAGLGKSITEEMRRRYHIPIKAAEKTDKLTAIALMNGDFIDGYLRVHASNQDLINQLKTTPRGEDGLEEKDAECDLLDAALYAYREAKHWTFEPKTPRLDRNSEEYIIQSLENEWKIKQDKSWWEQYES